jgi:hypothetical protein
MPKTFAAPTEASTWWPASTARCSPRAPNASRTSSRASAGLAARSPWRTGPRRDSSGRCSRPSAGSSPLLERRPRCFGATRPPCASGSAMGFGSSAHARRVPIRLPVLPGECGRFLPGILRAHQSCLRRPVGHRPGCPSQSARRAVERGQSEPRSERTIVPSEYLEVVATRA